MRRLAQINTKFRLFLSVPDTPDADKVYLTLLKKSRKREWEHIYKLERMNESIQLECEQTFEGVREACKALAGGQHLGK